MRVSDPVHNRLAVLRHLRAAEPVSRTGLAQLTGLTGSTVGTIVGDLVGKGLILEERQAAVGQGRPRVNLRINPDGAYAVAATLTDTGRGMIDIVNLKGQSVYSGMARFTSTTRLGNFAEQFAVQIARTMAESPIPRERISQIGIGLPACVDSRTGIVEYLETFELGPCNFAEIVEERLGIPVRLDNNVNLLARGEHWFGEKLDDFTLIALHLGLDAARYQFGQLLVGSHGHASEFGHVKVVANGRPCHCGGHGCLITYASGAALLVQANEQRGLPSPHIVRMPACFPELGELARNNDSGIAHLFEQAGDFLGMALANHINSQDPARIIVQIMYPELFEPMKAAFLRSVQRNTFPVLSGRARVMFKPLASEDYARGAAAMVLENLYLSGERPERATSAPLERPAVEA